jgi:hypothetical protein
MSVIDIQLHTLSVYFSNVGKTNLTGILRFDDINLSLL